MVSVTFTDSIKVVRQNGGSSGNAAVYKGYVNEHFNVIRVPNGGYLMAIMVGAMEKEQKLNDKNGNVDCLSFKCMFVNSATADQDCLVKISTIKHGKSVSALSCTLEQEGKVKISGMALFGKFGSEMRQACENYEKVLNHPELGPLLPPGHIYLKRPFTEDLLGQTVKRAIFDRFIMKFPPKDLLVYYRMMQLGKSKEMCPSVYRCYVSHEDPNVKISIPSLAAISDCNIPTVKAKLPFGDAGWVPSLTFDIQFFERADLTKVLCKYNLFSHGPGRMVEECEIYNPQTGSLLCCARQSGLVGITQKKSKL